MWCDLKLTMEYTGSGASKELQGQPPSMLYTDPSSVSHRVIFRWLILVLGLEKASCKSSLASASTRPWAT